MIKYHNIISLFWGVLFLVVLQKFATPEPIFRYIIPAFIVYSGFITLYNRWYLKKIEKYNFWLILKQLLLLASGFGLFLIIPSEFLRGMFLIVTVGVISFFEFTIGNSAENLLLNETLIIAFGIFSYFFAMQHYLPGYQTVYLAGVFFASSLLARAFYEFIPKTSRVKLIGAVAIGLFCSELYWALNFLPFHFSVLALLLFNFFYFCLILNYYFLFHILNAKKIQFHLMLVTVSSFLILISTPWKILK